MKLILENNINKIINNKNDNIDYILLHFDEKWIHNDYIKNYKSIEPNSYFEFENFNLVI